MLANATASKPDPTTALFFWFGTVCITTLFSRCCCRLCFLPCHLRNFPEPVQVLPHIPSCISSHTKRSCMSHNSIGREHETVNDCKAYSDTLQHSSRLICDLISFVNYNNIFLHGKLTTKKSATSRRWWQVWKEDKPVVLGIPCFVCEVGAGLLATTAVAPPVDVPIEP